MTLPPDVCEGRYTGCQGRAVRGNALACPCDPAARARGKQSVRSAGQSACIGLCSEERIPDGSDRANVSQFAAAGTGQVESSDRSSPTCPDELSLAPAAYGPPGAPMSDKAPRLQTNLRKSVSPAVVDTAVTSSRSFMSIGPLIDVPPRPARSVTRYWVKPSG